jgi:hypothetical protein
VHVNGELLVKKFLVVAATFGAIGWCAPASAGCMVRMFKDASGVDRPVKIVVPNAETDDYRTRGFQTTTCSAPDVAAFRTEACRLKTLGNSAVQKRLEEVLGASPAKMCASAMRAMPSSTPAISANDATAAPAASACTGDGCAK